MNSENLDQSHNSSIQQTDLSKSQITISEDVKSLLDTLLKKRLNKKLTKLEQKFSEEKKQTKYLGKKFEEYIKLLDSFCKEVNETVKEKGELSKKKHEVINEKNKIKVHISKSFAPNKRLKISTKNEYLTNKTDRKNLVEPKVNNISRTNYQTEIVKKSHIRPKTFKGQRIKDDNISNKKNIKPSQLVKNIIISSPLKHEDNKAKTIVILKTERKNDKKSSNLNNESKSVKKKLRILKSESGNLSESGKNIKKIDRFETEKNTKKTMTIIHDKLNKKGNGKKIINKKINDKIIKKTPNRSEKKDPEKKKENIKKEEEKIEKKENIENKDKKEDNIENKEIENNKSKEKLENNEYKKEEIKINEIEKSKDKEDKIQIKDNEEKIEENKEVQEEKQEKKEILPLENEQKIGKEIKEKEKNEKDLLKDSKKENEEQKSNEEKKENMQKTSPLHNQLASEENNTQNEKENIKEEIVVTKKVSEEENTPKEKENIKEEVVATKNSEDVIPETKENVLAKKEENEKIKENEIISENKTEIKPELNEVKEEPKKIEENDNKSSENNKVNLEEPKKEEKIEEKNNENPPQKTENQNNEKLIENIRKDNEEMKKDNEEELLKHYQSQMINIDLNQSMNQSLNFSQSFLQSRSILGEKTQEKISRDPNIPLTKDEIIKKYKNYFIYVFDFLDFKERIIFTGIHRGYKNERLYLFNTKREEAIASLELKEKETLDDRINQFKLSIPSDDYTKPFGKFTVAKSSSSATLSLNKPTFYKLFNETNLSIKLNDVYIVFRALFILMGETKIAEVEDDSQFWIKCTEYLKRDGIDKVGSFILEKSKNFDFSHKTIYLLNKLLVGIKPNINASYFSKISGTTGMVIFIVKDALEFCGVLVSKKTQKSRIYDNLMYYKNIIDNLTNFIDFLSKLNFPK